MLSSLLFENWLTDMFDSQKSLPKSGLYCNTFKHGIISVLAISYLSATSFTLSLMCCVHERSPTSWSVERICRQWLRCHAFFCRHLFPMAFLSIVSFLSIEKQMMLREWRRAATHHKSLINWAMRVLAKEILGFKCVLSEIFWCEWPFLGILSLAYLS